jgi:hypothetical protein
MTEDQNTVQGVVDAVTKETIESKKNPGKTFPKFTFVINGRSYSGIGELPATVIKGDLVALKLTQSGQFTNVTDVLKGGVSIMPKRFPPRAPAISPKALTMLAAVLVCRHNSQLKNVPITIADIKATMPELEKLVGES